MASMAWDVYIHSADIDTTIIRNVVATSPDQALDKVETAGDYIPSKGDRIRRIRAVDDRSKAH
jgi:hypothetical protein